ncbi:DNA-binding protein [Globomyces pollinis-pini]|nr:DNA-binding protein [Globomyces pollinis-pini]
MNHSEPNIIETVDIVVEFIEIAIHYILFIRNVYEIPVQQSRHPELNGYIQDLLLTIKPDLLNGSISKFYVCINDSQSNLLEKFTFQMKSMINDLSESQQADKTGSGLKEIQQYLRAFLMKISCLDAQLMPNPSDCTWCAWVEIVGDDPSPTKSTHLIPGEPSEIKVENGRLLPLRTLDTGLIKMEMFVEESGSKYHSSTQLSEF